VIYNQHNKGAPTLRSSVAIAVPVLRHARLLVGAVGILVGHAVMTGNGVEGGYREPA
jgi:hypothetical protein